MRTPQAKGMEIVNTVDTNGWKTLRVTVPWEEVSGDYNDILEKYRGVRIPGFRAGKAPRPVVEKRFEREIMDELSHRCGSRMGRDALTEAGAEPLGPVEAVDIECAKERPFRFTIRFYPMPEITLPEIDSFTITDDGTDPRDRISKGLLEQVSFEVPDELVRAELGKGIGDEVTRLGVEWKAAADRVRLMLILKRIARREGIEVDESDVERRIEEKAAEFGEDVDSLKAEFEKGGGRQRLKDLLLAESTLNFLIEKSGG